jgi:type IV secretion system protein TrbG
MNKPKLLAAASMLALGACAGQLKAGPPPGAAPAGLVPAMLVEPAEPPAPVPEPEPVAAEPVRAEVQLLPPPDSSRPRERATPAARIESANRAATREPSGHNYVNASQVYAWSEGAIYRLYTAPERVSEIALQPGEALVSVAAGDTARWVIGDTTSGSGTGRRTHILVKPSAVGLRTNLVITTDRRVYHVQLESTARTAMTSMSWTYPENALIALRRDDAAPDAAAFPVPPGELSLDELDFGYRIEGDDPPWRPLRAFDDGRQVFIEFPATLARGEAPPLFVRGEGRGPELVNYRLRGRYYVVDRLFTLAELRLGERRQQVVRIVRTGAERAQRRGRAS